LAGGHEDFPDNCNLHFAVFSVLQRQCSPKMGVICAIFSPK
jgi:hypothetical protein